MYNNHEDGCFALAVPNTGITALNLNQEINLFGSCTNIFTTEKVTYPVIQDDPTQLEKDNGWVRNLVVGTLATVALAALAVATALTGGAALAVVALAGSAVGTAAVTAGATYSDIKSGNSRSLGEFAFQLTMGAAIGFTTGASIYGLVTAIPAASAAMGVEASLLTGSTSTLTAVTIPNLVTAGGYAVAGGMGTVAVNESFAMGSGTNVLVETVFDGDVQAYETTTMCIDMLGMMYVQCGMDNAALGMNESEEQGSKGGKKGVYLEGESGNESGSDAKVKPSNPYNVDEKPSGTVTKITNKMDEATRRSLTRENEAAETIAKNGYNIEQNPAIEGTTRNPDYLIEGEIFDCYSPAENTKVRNVASTIEEKVIQKGQAERVVLNLDDWKGNVDELVKQLNDYPIEGLKEVIIVYDGTVQSIYP